MSLCSCDCGDGEVARFFHVTSRKARKIYSCCECGATIGVGEPHEYISALWDSFRSFRTCAGCAEVRKKTCQEIGFLWSDFGDWTYDVGVADLDKLPPVGRAKLVEMLDRRFSEDDA